MSLEAMSLVWKYSKHKGTLLLLELALADYANDDNICWPAINTLARKIRLDRRQTKRLLIKLEDSKEIKVVEVGGGYHTDTNHYLITIKPRKKTTGGVQTPRHSTGGLQDTTGGVQTPNGGSAGQGRGVYRAGTGGVQTPQTTIEPPRTPNESLNQPPPPQESEVASAKKSQSVAVAVVDGQWCLAGLLDCGKVYKKRREAVPVGASATIYVSNYLYALTQKGFSKPPSFWAAARLCEGKPAGEPFDELASLEPERLAYILLWSADPYGVVLDGDETLALRWRGVWAKGVDADKAQQALSDLGLTVFAPAAAPEPERIETTDLDRWCDVVGGMRGHRQMFQHLSAARFLDASNGSVRILVADERIKTAIETAMPVIAPSLSKMFGAKVLAVEVREV